MSEVGSPYRLDVPGTVTIDSMIRDNPARVGRILDDIVAELGISEALLPPTLPTRRHAGLAAWFYRGVHRARRWWQHGEDPITVADLERQARRERPSVPLAPILLGTRTCRFYPMPGYEPVGGKGVVVTVAPDGGTVIEVAELDVAEAHTGPILT